MKQYKASAFFIILALILLTSPQPTLADQQWHYQASAEVTQPGLIETVLPAGVFFGTDQVRQLKLKYDHQDEYTNGQTFLGSYHTDDRKCIVVW